jgi:heme/copper-type cytochrome/quinol oxidase subunit 2
MKSVKAVAFATVLLAGSFAFAQAPKTYEVLADGDNVFKMPGQKKPVITVKAGQVVKLKIVGKKGTEMAKDGSVHSFTINALKDQGWDLPVKEGVNEYTVVAPAEPGEYVIECAVKCGNGHEDMKMKLVVTK